MSTINTMQGTRKIAWTEDDYGQWSSGDLEVRPVLAKHGPVCWNLFLNGERVGRSYGYARPGLAKATAPLIGKVRKILAGCATEPSYQDLRKAVIDLMLLCRRIARMENAQTRAELCRHVERIVASVGCETSGLLRTEKET